MNQQTKKTILKLSLFVLAVLSLSLLFCSIFYRHWLKSGRPPDWLLRQSGEEQDTEETTSSLFESQATTAEPVTVQTTATTTPTTTETSLTGPEIKETSTYETDVARPAVDFSDVYADVSAAVAGIRVLVPAGGSQTAQMNEGSGLIFDSKGFVVTCSDLFDIALNRQGKLLAGVEINLTVEGANRVFRGQLMGRDKALNLAVVKIISPVPSFKILPFADRNDIKVGQAVVAIGHSDLLEAQGRASVGWLTALGYPLVGEDATLIRMMESNVELKPQNAGSPLINLKGEVIGLTNCGIDIEQYSNNVYALSADTVSKTAYRLLDEEAGTPSVRLGAICLNAESFLQLQEIYDYPDGLLLASIVPDSPAYIANLQKGDIILSINQEQVLPVTRLSRVLSGLSEGAVLDLEVYRPHEDRTLVLRAYLKAPE